MNNNYKKNLSVAFDQAKRPNKLSGVSHEQEKWGRIFFFEFQGSISGKELYICISIILTKTTKNPVFSYNANLRRRELS